MEGWIMLRILTAGAATAVVGAVLLTGAHTGAHAAQAQPERFTTYRAPVGAEVSPAQAQATAVHVARLARQAGALRLTTAHSTFARAHAVLMGGSPAAADESGPPERVEEMRSPVWVTVMTESTGQSFTPIAPHPRKHRGPSGAVMVVVSDAHTGFVKEEYVGQAAPNVALLGPTVSASVAAAATATPGARVAAVGGVRWNPRQGLIVGTVSPARVGWPVTLSDAHRHQLATRRTSAADSETAAGSFSFRAIAGTYEVGAPGCRRRAVRVRGHRTTTITLHCAAG